MVFIEHLLCTRPHSSPVMKFSFQKMKRRGKEVDLEKGSKSIYYHLRRMDRELTRSSKRNDEQN